MLHTIQFNRRALRAMGLAFVWTTMLCTMGAPAGADPAVPSCPCSAPGPVFTCNGPPTAQYMSVMNERMNTHPSAWRESEKQTGETSSIRSRKNCKKVLVGHSFRPDAFRRHKRIMWGAGPRSWVRRGKQ